MWVYTVACVPGFAGEVQIALPVQAQAQKLWAVIM